MAFDPKKLKGMRAETLDMTPEVKAKLARVAKAVDTLLKEEFDGPVEAYTVLCYLKDSYEMFYGIAGMLKIQKDEPVA
jgi:hypothetical protein